MFKLQFFVILILCSGNLFSSDLIVYHQPTYSSSQSDFVMEIPTCKRIKTEEILTDENFTNLVDQFNLRIDRHCNIFESPEFRELINIFNLVAREIYGNGELWEIRQKALRAFFQVSDDGILLQLKHYLQQKPEFLKNPEFKKLMIRGTYWIAHVTMQSLIAQKNSEKMEGVFRLYESLSQDHIDAKYDVAIMLQYGQGCAKDFPRAKAILEELANNEALSDEQRITGESILGTMYHHGLYGVSIDLDKSLEYYKRAHSHGSFCDSQNIKRLLEEQYRWAIEYQKGLYGPQDIEKALGMLNWLVSKEYNPASYRLGEMYENGECCVEKDLDRACEHYIEAIRTGHPLAEEAAERILSIPLEE